MKKLLSATYIGEFQILLIYEKEKPRVFDFKPWLKKNLGDFENLKDESVFKKFEILKGWNTIEWLNGFDISPEVLYESSYLSNLTKVV